MQLCFARAKPIRLKISQKKPDLLAFSISKKNKGVKKKPEFQHLVSKKEIGNPSTQELRMRIKNARKPSIFCYL